MQDPEDFQSGQTAGEGRFELRSKLGRGGMGVVWRAYDKRLREEVALKFLHRAVGLDPEAIEDMRREVLKSRKLTHVNVIRIHDLEEHPGELPFISMEYVAGSSLHVLRREQPHRFFTWPTLRPMARQLCAALDYAHEESVIHRDLKPGNLMLDTRFRLKLADFGLAATLTESISRRSMKNSSAGTPAYMSPQQMDGKPPQVTDDIYSLGATLYELLTSKPPFYQGDITNQVRTINPEPVEERLRLLGRANDVPENVSRAILACLAKEPRARPQTVPEVVEWMQLAEEGPNGAGHKAPRWSTAGEGESGPDTRQPMRLTRTTARPWVAWGIGGGGVLLAVALAAALYLWEKSRDPGTAHVTEATPTPHKSVTPWPDRTVKQVEPIETEPAPVPAPQNGFAMIFNGITFDGDWKPIGSASCWSINPELGAIQCDLSKSRGRGLSEESLRWIGNGEGRVSNFELRLEMRADLSALNAAGVRVGVRYRVADQKGYRFNLTNGSAFLGELCRLNGHPISDPEYNVIVSGNETPQPLGEKRAGVLLPSVSEKGRWLKIRIDAQSGQLVHYIDDKISANVKDNNSKLLSLGGQLELVVSTDQAASGVVLFRRLQIHE